MMNANFRWFTSVTMIAASLALALSTPQQDSAVVEGFQYPPHEPIPLPRPQNPLGSTRPTVTNAIPPISGGPLVGGPATAYEPSLRQFNSPGIQAYKNAQTSEQKAEAKELIRRELEEHYDAFLETRATEIAKLQERIVKLREQLDRRRDAKARMVELKLEMVISQADGLGWPDGWGVENWHPLLRVYEDDNVSMGDGIKFYRLFPQHHSHDVPVQPEPAMPSAPDAVPPAVRGGGGAPPR